MRRPKHKAHSEAVKRAIHVPTKAPQELGQVWDCTCYHDCGADSESGDWHQHEDEPCPIHPEAPVVG